jgi:hypothetical protein
LDQNGILGLSAAIFANIFPGFVQLLKSRIGISTKTTKFLRKTQKIAPKSNVNPEIGVAENR